MYNFTALSVIFLFALGASVLATALVARGARRYGIVSRPNPIVPQHTREVAYLGGVGVMLGWALTVAGVQVFQASELVSGLKLSAPLGFVIGSILFLVLGIGDDLRAFSAAPKFALQVLAAAVAVGLGSIYPASGIWLVDTLVSMLWIVTVVNAMNFVDVCDGLAGGLALVMLLALAAFGGSTSLVLIAGAGAVAGFLVHNLPPARVFLGDAGSHLLGFWLAAASLLGAKAHGAWPWWPAMLLLLGVPLFETAFITVVRYRKGLPWWKGSPDHFALRLQAVGFSRWQTDLLAWSVAVLLGMAAHLLLRAPWPLQCGLLCTVALAAAAVCRWLYGCEVETVKPAISAIAVSEFDLPHALECGLERGEVPGGS
jgi:UDP-GlcNAc:undecaprenyl-phosphate GlcNAc-1-phosphate transferase